MEPDIRTSSAGADRRSFHSSWRKPEKREGLARWQIKKRGKFFPDSWDGVGRHSHYIPILAIRSATRAPMDQIFRIFTARTKTRKAQTKTQKARLKTQKARAKAQIARTKAQIARTMAQNARAKAQKAQTKARKAQAMAQNARTKPLENQEAVSRLLLTFDPARTRNRERQKIYAETHVLRCVSVALLYTYSHVNKQISARCTLTKE
ncbi:unnamed protein product [Trichogramma brassicae]|uniref:Uncharacterized protein n=1 Tax=Trichogramma brassicae TaxID=86971 RepID=A0A6H5I3B4_9HYME|nr:unnamed protein product [Trichogramma brassicae]